MTITSFDKKMFHQAYIEATKSTFDRFHVGAVIAYKGHIYMIVDCMEEDIDECYDVLAIALCHAAQRYKSNRCYYGRYGFEEYAKVIMLSEYYGDKYRNSYQGYMLRRYVDVS